MVKLTYGAGPMRGILALHRRYGQWSTVKPRARQIRTLKIKVLNSKCFNRFGRAFNYNCGNARARRDYVSLNLSQ